MTVATQTEDKETQKQPGPLAATVQFWAMLGPLLIVAALITSLVKETSGFSLIIPTVGLFGIPFCWRWKMVGLAATLVMLFISFLVVMSYLPVEDRFWEAGMAMAFALGFVITTLSLEESEKIIENIQVESRSRLQNLWRLDERLRQSRANWEEEYHKVVQELQKQTKETEEMAVRINGYEKMISYTRQDLDQAQKYREKLEKELLEKPAPAEDDQLRQRIRELKGELKKIRGQDPHWQELQRTKGMYQQLREQFEEKKEVLEKTQKTLFQKEENIMILQKEVEEQQLLDMDHVVEDEIPDQSNQDVQEEIRNLQELVSMLTEELNRKEDKTGNLIF